ncbi:MAG: class I SAM-dependent methyltransferase [Chthoniobacterales bacterium]
MKVSHKIAKLGRSESYKRSWRRLRRRLRPIALQPLLEKLDPAQLQEIQERYASSPVQIAKYADVDRYMKLNIERVQDLQLHRSTPKEILDLGCGGGFFLYICQQHGHRCQGLDLEWFPVFTDLLNLMKVERKVWEIKAFEPLPDLGRKFNWITAFSTGFNRVKKKPWRVPEWKFFLDDLQKHLLPGGKVFFALNPEGRGGQYYDEELRAFFVRSGAQIERERIFFPALGSGDTAADQ